MGNFCRSVRMIEAIGCKSYRTCSLLGLRKTRRAIEEGLTTMKDLLKTLVSGSPDYVEMRYHRRVSTGVSVRTGRLEQAARRETAGVGVRALVLGAWGFAATTDLSRAGLQRALDEARASARLLAAAGARKVKLADAVFAQESIDAPGVDELLAASLADKVAKVIDTEAALRKQSTMIQAANVGYAEIIEEKVIVHSHGACCSYRMSIPEFRATAIAERDGEQMSHGRACAVRGGWDEVFAHHSMQDLVESVSKGAVDLLAAPSAAGGRHRIILSPDVVGLIAHEAIGHTVEADLVESGSVAQGAIGRRVASELVTLGDSGYFGRFGNAGAGSIPFDDEGVRAGDTIVIENGILQSYLHDRESAARYGVTPTGNSRAWLFDDEPLIRMRNTWVAPGAQSLDELIQGMSNGYLAEGGQGGQADSNGEFMFGVDALWEIRDGRRTRLCRGATLSGKAFDVLASVDGVSSDFRFDLGSGHCGKGQPAKVDAGGPFLRCEISVGGKQS